MSGAVIRFRDAGGRIAPLSPTDKATIAAEKANNVAQAREVYRTYLEAVCRHQALSIEEVDRQCARPGRPNADSEWRRAVYARQLALYLAHTERSARVYLLAAATGLTQAGVLWAIAAIEDLRDNQTFDLRVDIVAAEMGVTP